MAEHFDLIVIGSGPAGEKGAAQAAYFNKKVALIERNPEIGGAGINTGTVPSKTLREAALYFSGLRQRGLYGIDYSLRENLSVKDFMHREQLVVMNEHAIIWNNLRRHNITLFYGEACLVDAHTVRVTRPDCETEISGEVVLVATGSAPWHPPGIPFDGKLIFDSDTILRMQRIPRSMAVIGGGVIGTEYASIFTALGVQVMLVDPKERILPFVDHEIIQRLQDQLQKLGLEFAMGHRVTAVEPQEDSVRVTLDDQTVREFEILLVTMGRQSNVQGLGLEQLGVQLGNRGVILVNDKYQTNVPGIYAAGDVIGFPALASTSMEQARVAVSHAFHLTSKEEMSSVVPGGLCHPRNLDGGDD